MQDPKEFAAMTVWIFAIAFSTSLLAVAAGGRISGLHVLAAATITIFFALSAAYELRNAEGRGARGIEIACLATRYMTLVWIWAAVAIFVTYGLILDWKPWWYYVAVLLVGATVCAFFAGRFGAVRTREEARSGLKLARMLAVIQMATMIVVIAGLAFDFPSGARGVDWAAHSILFFGALSLLAISAIAMRTRPSGGRLAAGHTAKA